MRLLTACSPYSLMGFLSGKGLKGVLERGAEVWMKKLAQAFKERIAINGREISFEWRCASYRLDYYWYNHHGFPFNRHEYWTIFAVATTSDNLAAWIRCIDISSSTPSQFLLYTARCGCDLQMVPRLFLWRFVFKSRHRVGCGMHGG